MVENAKPRKRRPQNIDGSIEECLSQYEPTFTLVARALQRLWARELWIPSIEEEIRSTMLLIFVKAYHDRKDTPGLFPPPPELLYARTRWALMAQWASKDSIHRHARLEVYDTIEHWNPENPDAIATRKNRIGINESIFPYAYPPDMLDFWFLGLSTRQIGVLYNKTSRTVLRIIHSYYDAIDRARLNPDDAMPRYIPSVPRPRRGECNKKTPSY